MHFTNSENDKKILAALDVKFDLFEKLIWSYEKDVEQCVTSVSASRSAG